MLKSYNFLCVCRAGNTSACFYVKNLVHSIPKMYMCLSFPIFLLSVFGNFALIARDNDCVETGDDGHCRWTSSLTRENLIFLASGPLDGASR